MRHVIASFCAVNHSSSNTLSCIDPEFLRPKVLWLGTWMAHFCCHILQPHQKTYFNATHWLFELHKIKSDYKQPWCLSLMWSVIDTNDSLEFYEVFKIWISTLNICIVVLYSEKAFCTHTAFLSRWPQITVRLQDGSHMGIQLCPPNFCNSLSGSFKIYNIQETKQKPT